jgi:hypothetical protein
MAAPSQSYAPMEHNLSAIKKLADGFEGIDELLG